MRLNRFVLFSLLLSGAALIWLVMDAGTPDSSLRINRRGVDQRVHGLIDKLEQGSLSAAEHTALLEQLLSLGQLKDAQMALEAWQAEAPLPLDQRLLLVELMRLNGDLTRANRELTQLVRLHPNNLEITALQALVEHDRGEGVASLNRLKARFQATKAGQRTELGLLLSDLYRQNGDAKRAEDLYRTLASESQEDARPVLALALLRVEQGQGKAVRELLSEAERRRVGDGQDDLQIQALAATWGVAAAQIRAGQTDPTSTDLR